MGGRVVLKFGGGKKIRPGSGVVGTEDTKISFDFLVISL